MSNSVCFVIEKALTEETEALKEEVGKKAQLEEDTQVKSPRVSSWKKPCSPCFAVQLFLFLQCTSSPFWLEGSWEQRCGFFMYSGPLVSTGSASKDSTICGCQAHASEGLQGDSKPFPVVSRRREEACGPSPDLPWPLQCNQKPPLVRGNNFPSPLGGVLRLGKACGVGYQPSTPSEGPAQV